MIKAVLWDLDGTLVESVAHHWQAWREVAAAEGLPLTYDQFTGTFGKRNDEILVEWSGGRLDSEARRRIAATKEARFRELVRAHGLAPLPGAVDWIERLRQAGWKQAIATSAPGLNMEAMLDALGLRGQFDAHVAAEDVVNGKPAPDVFLTAAARVGADPSRSVVVEDAAAGVQAGRAAGIRTIAVNERPLPGADLWVRSLTELADDAFESLIRPVS